MPRPDWYGFSERTAERGYNKLVKAGVMRVHTQMVRDHRSPIGLRPVFHRTLLGPYETQVRRDAQKKPAAVPELERRLRRDERPLRGHHAASPAHLDGGVQMSAGKITAGLVGGTGGVIAIVASPVPALVIGGLLGVVILVVAIVVLMAACSTDERRHAHAVTTIDRVLAAIPGARRWTPPILQPSPTPAVAEDRAPKATR